MAYPGDVIQGRYQIMEEIGKGGGGTVFLAFHLSMRQYMVLKEIRNVSSYSDREALRNEVDILKRLKHADLPQVYDYIDIDGAVFTVMEYIPGQSIQDYLKTNPAGVSQEQTVLWARELAQVLAYMHTRDEPVIHGDVKPSNIMIRPDGSLCLIDFNISDDTSKGVGVSGFSKGYASPEQMEKAYYQERRIPSPHIHIDARSDIYSLGAVLYFILTGEIPNQNPTPLSDNPTYFYPLARIVDTCLKQDVQERYQTADDLVYALNHLEKTDEDFIRWTWIRRGMISLGLLLIAVGISLLFFWKNVRQKRLYYEAYNQFVDAVSSSDSSMEEKGLNLLNNGDWAGYLNSHPEEKENVLFSLASEFMNQGKYDNAISYFEEALDTGQAEEECYSRYFSCCIDQGYLQRAEEVREEAGHSSVSKDLLDLMDGRLAMYKGENQEAISVFSDLMEEGHPEEVRGQAGTWLGQLYLSENDYRMAREVLSRKINPNVADYLNLSMAYEYDHDPNGAGKALESAMEAYPDDPRPYIRMGLLVYSKGHYKDAETWYQEARKRVIAGQEPEGYKDLEEAVNRRK